MDNVVDAFRRWLPHPVYRFVGGPADGKTLAVDLIEMPHGLMAPEQWNIAEPAEFAITDKPPEDVSAIEVAVHTYRFVPRGGSMNEGYYEWEEPF